MMNCNNTIQCHDSRQKDNTMVHNNILKNEMLETGLYKRNLKLSSSINRIMIFLKKNRVNRNALAQLLHIN
jgi:hypothetical protein